MTQWQLGDELTSKTDPLQDGVDSICMHLAFGVNVSYTVPLLDVGVDSGMFLCETSVGACKSGFFSNTSS